MTNCWNSTRISPLLDMRSPNSRVRCKLISFLVKRQSWLISYIFVSELVKKLMWSFLKQKRSTNIKKKKLKHSQKRTPTNICSFVSTHSAQYRRQEHDEIAMAPFNQNKHILQKSRKNNEYKENRNDTMNKWKIKYTTKHRTGTNNAKNTEN